MKVTFHKFIYDANPPGGGPGDTPPAGDPPPGGDTGADDPPPGGEGDTPPADEPDFWAEVSQRFGDGLPLVIPDMDQEELLTPAGVHAVLLANMQKNLERYELQEAEKDPRAYAYKLHRMRGGSDDEFFATKSSVLPTLVELEQNVDLQKKFYTDVLKSRGLDQDEIEAALNVSTPKLFEKVQKAHQQVTEQEVRQRNELAKQQEREQQERELAVRNVTSNIQTVITENALDNLLIPTGDIPEFTKFVQAHLWELPGGKFGFVQEVDDKTLSQKLEALYYQFAKGDMKKMVPKVKRPVAQQLRLGIKKEAQQQQQQQQQQQNQKPSMGDAWRNRGK